MRLFRMCLNGLVCLAAMIALALCVEKYLLNEKGVRVSRVSWRSTSMPSFTLCWQFGYKASVLRRLGMPMDVNAMISKHFPPLNMSTKAFLKETSTSLEQFLVSIKLVMASPINNHYNSDNNDDDDDEGYTIVVWSKDVDNDGERGNLIEFRPVQDKIHGRCYTSSIPSHLLEYGLLKIRFDFDDVDDIARLGLAARDEGWIIRLHPEGQIHRYYLDIPATKSVLSHYDLVYDIYHRIGNCDPLMNEGYDECYTSGMRQLSVKREGCYAFWHMTSIEDDNICNERSFYARDHLYNDIADEVKDKDKEGSCQEPCDIMRMRSTLGVEQRLRNEDSISRNESIVILHLSEVVKVADEFVVYNLLSMVGEAGGYLGLFTGISALCLVDIFT